MPDKLETDIGDLLADLADVQGELLDHLAHKRELIANNDDQALLALQDREAALVQRLSACHARRQQILDEAAADGRRADSISELSQTLEPEARDKLLPTVQDTQSQSRLLHHQSLTNWVIVQRTLIHLSQMIEIIATGGRSRPTYSKEGNSIDSGSLIDHAA